MAVRAVTGRIRDTSGTPESESAKSWTHDILDGYDALAARHFLFLGTAHLIRDRFAFSVNPRINDHHPEHAMIKMHAITK